MYMNLYTEGVSLTLYRRHLKSCSGSNLAGNIQRQYTDCACPIWMYGRTEKELVPRQSTGTSDWGVAEAMRRSLDNKAKDEAIHGLLLRDCAAKYCSARRNELTEKTLDYSRKTIGRLCDFCEKHGVFRTDDLNVDLLETFKTDGLDGYAETTKALAVAKVRCFLREAFRRGWIKEHLAEKMRPHNYQHEQKSPYSEDEVARILAGASTLKNKGKHGFSSHPKTFSLLLELMLQTGIRVGDAVIFDPARLTKGDRLWVYTYIPQKSVKVKKLVPKTVYISEQLKAAIDICSWMSAKLPFYYQDGNCSRVAYVGVYDLMQRIGKRCGVKDCRPHRLRDTFAVRSLLRGVALDDVSRLLGHSSVKITEAYYAKWIPARAKRLEGLVADRLLSEPLVNP